MAAPSKAWDHQVDDRIDQIAEGLQQRPDFSEKEVPGLRNLLKDYIAPDVVVTDVAFAARLLKVFKDSETDDTYSKHLQKQTADEQKRIERFVAGEDLDQIGDGFVLGPSMGCREELQKLREATSVVHVTPTGITKVKGDIEAFAKEAHHWFHSTVKDLMDFFGARKAKMDDAGILVYHNADFQNWGLNVKNEPSLTLVPSTSKEIQTIVRFAKEHKMSVRCSGYRHSWSPIFARNGHILISLLNLHTASKLPNIEALPLPDSPPTELETIEIAPGAPRKSGNTLVRVGSACTNERLRRWCIKNNQVALPLNIIMVEITMGGSNAPICHGAGRRNRTLSDLVCKIEYVTAHGELRTVEEPRHLLAAGGCFGLLGVVTHITLEFDPMTYALLKPLKIPAIWAVPPPANLSDKDIPPALFKYWKDLSSEKKASYQQDFEKRCTNDYYSEWFWFPYSDYSWVNTWDNTEDASGVVQFPDNAHIFLSFVQSFTLNVLQNSPLLGKLISAVNLSEAAVTLISRAAMFALPEKEVKTYLPDALHFQRSIQNIRVRDLEVEMPLVAKKGSSVDKTEIDYAPVQRAWWDAILLTYANSETCPMRMPLEMRIMGGSDIIMAPQRGNVLGTCAIEVLTLYSARDVWLPFAQQVLDKWMAIKNPATGEGLRTTPHWAKEWYGGLKVDGKPWIDRLKNEDYKAERQEFVNVLTDIGKEHGWKLSDLKSRFSNELFDDLFFGGDLKT